MMSNEEAEESFMIISKIVACRFFENAPLKSIRIEFSFGVKFSLLKTLRVFSKWQGPRNCSSRVIIFEMKDVFPHLDAPSVPIFKISEY
jgi:hypothetical protein